MVNGMVQTFDVVITGVGVVSPIGIGREAFWTALRQGRSGVATIEQLRDTDSPITFGAEVADFDGKQFVTPRKALKVMSRELQTAYAAAALAMGEAGLDPATLDASRFGVVYSSDMLYCDPHELIEPFSKCAEQGKFVMDHWGPQAISQMFPLWMLKYLPNMAACHIGIANDARGPNNTICQGDASSLLALIEAVNVIRRGHADVMISGGSSSRLGLTPMMYRGGLNHSRRSDAPASACRPFDADRDGVVNGEGAGAMILETRQHAVARGAKILAVVAGYGMTFDLRCQGQETQDDAIARSLRMALETAELTADDIGHVNAHGLSSVVHDAREAQAIRQVLCDAPVTAPKSLFGNMGAGGGSVEAVASVMALESGEIPPTLNFERPDPACPVNVVRGKPRKSTGPAAMVMSQSTTGQVASVVLARG